MERSLFDSILLVEPCTIQHLETLLAGREIFSKEFGISVADDYELIPEILKFSLNHLMDKTVFPCWWTHVYILYEPRILIGIGGYKGNPSPEGMVEIGYSIAESYQNRGLGTQAAKMLIDRAFKNEAINFVTAHTLPYDNPSTSILKKVGMKRIAEVEHPRHGKVWRWEIQK